MAAYSRVYDSRHVQADCQQRDQLRNPTLGNRVWDTFLQYEHSRVLLLLCTRRLCCCKLLD